MITTTKCDSVLSKIKLSDMPPAENVDTAQISDCALKRTQGLHINGEVTIL